MKELPLTQPESETLELKSTEILADPDKIAREVVAMLNAKGGEIWIGLKESGGGRHQIEPIADAAGKLRRLRDHLLDVIEPRLLSTEISVTVEGQGNEGPVLLVSVAKGLRGPYALLRSQGARYFLRRFTDRIVPMSREEIFDAAKEAAPEESAARATLLKAQLQLLERGPERLWLRLEPESPGHLDWRILARSEILSDPTFTHTSRASFNFAAAIYGGKPRIKASEGERSLRVGDDKLSLRFFRTGGIELAVSIPNLWAGRVPFVDEPKLLSPEALGGYLISVFRLAGTLLQQPSFWTSVPPHGDIWALLAVRGLQGWCLLPGDLAQWPSMRYALERYRYTDPDFRMAEPVRFTVDEIRDSPDVCGLRLIERLYDAFGILQLPTVRSMGL